MAVSAEEFVKTLQTYASEAERKKIERYFQSDPEDNQVIGVRMKRIFDLAKASTDMPLEETENLLERPYYEARMGAVSIMDFLTRRKNTSEEQRKALFDLYIERHDRINNWDLVDRAAGRVVGGYLYEFDKSRAVLYELARSNGVWERRTAIVSTSYFIGKGELDDTYGIAEILMGDDHDLIHKAVGSWIRHAGQKDQGKLLDFLDRHAATMSRTMLRYATEKLDEERRVYYRGVKRGYTAEPDREATDSWRTG